MRCSERSLSSRFLAAVQEFIVLLVLCWLLRPSTAKEGSLMVIDKAMQTLVDAFQFFDRENRGWITKKDVSIALGTDDTPTAHAHHEAPASNVAAGRRFSEMDFSRDGKVTFPEFVLAIESWAGLDED